MNYLITTHRHLPGVALSRPNHWGGIRFASDEEAVAAAKRDGGDRVVIERETIRK